MWKRLADHNLSIQRTGLGPSRAYDRMHTSLDNGTKKTGDQAGPEDLSCLKPTFGTAALKPTSQKPAETLLIYLQQPDMLPVLPW